MTEKNTSTGGITFMGALALLLIALKLLGIIEWSWLWVLAPIWLRLCFAVLTTLILLLIRRRHD